MFEIKKKLKDIFGHNSFRESQEDGIRAILEGRDLFMILPTGGGKSLVYQLPTLIMDGVTVVISPLIALMQDQVASLQAQNIPAEMISSAQTFDEIENICSLAINNKIKFLYLSPERLNDGKTINILKQIKLNFFVIDEAHCISQWGHEFREDYRNLKNLRINFPTIPITAFTATATTNVANDILNELLLKDPLLLKGKVFRKNLFISVQRRISNGYDQLKHFLLKHQKESGIIYVHSRKKAHDLSQFLNQNGYKTLPYHAGLPQHVREENFKMFVNDNVEIIVATIAFGMGIDKSDIRFVVHLALPKSLENYYQEIGRAGRDSEESETLLLFNSGDILQHKNFLNDIADENYKRHLNQKIDTIYRYATAQICFHKQLAQYFEDNIDECKNRCDNCLDEQEEQTDITKQSQMLLSTIYRTKEIFGKNYIIDVLRGSKDKKLLANNADKLSVYGVGKEIQRREWFVIVERLLELGIIKLGEFSALKLTNEAIDVLKSNKTVSINLSRLTFNKRAKKVTVEEFEYDADLFEKLREKRAKLAQDMQLPAYLIFSDKTLKHMAFKKPTNKAEMLQINGVGEKKFQQFGDEFLELFNV